MKVSPALRRFPALTASATAILALAACDSGIPAGLDEDALRASNCQAEDLPSEYYLQNEGTFTAGNIEDLAALLGSSAPDEVGLEGGFTAFWRERVGRPPFEPPGSAVCTLLQFESPEKADAFVEALHPDPVLLMTLGLTWLPPTGRTAEEVSDPAERPGTRAFALSGRGDGTQAEVAMVVIPVDELVVIVYDAVEEGAPEVERAAAAAESVAERAATRSQ